MKRLLLPILLVLLLIPKVYSKPSKYGPENASKKVLLAFEPTRFKKELLKQMIKIMDTGDIYIEVIEKHKKEISNYKADSFDVVFISNSGAKAKVRPWIVEWLNKNGTSPENVIVHTTQTTDWIPEIKVDSITSASVKGDAEIEKLAQKYVEQIKNKLFEVKKD